MSKIESLRLNALPAGNNCRVLSNTVRAIWLLAILGIAGNSWAQEAKYTIETNSPESWSAYYMRTGLGPVYAIPRPIGLTSSLADHCRWLTENTDHDWIPLGYSVELGYKLCYRTGPFSTVEAETYCGRLDMGVIENSRLVIVCGGKWGGYQAPLDQSIKWYNDYGKSHPVN